MPIPLAVAVPAAAAGLAYLNAKSQVWYDFSLLNAAFTGLGRVYFREKRDRLNLFYVLEEWAKSPSHANKNLIIFEGRRHTYSQVYDRALRYATWLRETLGVKPGDIVAMDYQNSDDFIFFWWALWSMGAKPAFINYNLGGNALAHCLKESTAKVCIVDPNMAHEFTDEVKSQFPEMNFVTFTPDRQAEALTHAATRSPDADRHCAKLSDMSMLIYTSGTTGMPKPAVVSWGKCIVGAALGQKIIRLGPKEIMYTSMPLYHSSAAVLSFCTVIQSGSTQALGRKFSTKTFWNDVRESEATMVQYVGETLRYLLSAPPQLDPQTGENLDKKHKVRLAYGNGLRPDIWNKFKERFGVQTIAEFYSATEGTFACFNISNNDFTVGAIGRTGWAYNLILGRNLAVVRVDWANDTPHRDPKTNFCQKVATGEPGEVLNRLPADVGQRFQGYFNNPGATQKKVLRDVFTKGDAWFRTGDIMRWDAEGRIFFQDRIGDTFRWKSENVSTTEVSQAIGTHPAVREANVYGVELPNHDGRAGCAAVHIAPDAALDETLQTLASHARASLPRYAVPRFLRVRHSSHNESAGGQTTGTMKQQKTLLRKAGVSPDAEGQDRELGQLYWLDNNAKAYTRFGMQQWKDMKAGRAKL